MKFLFIRHDESMNNIIMKKLTDEEYQKQRSEDPGLSPGAYERCVKLGKFLKENGFIINKFICSLQRRALETLKYISNAYDPEIKIPRESKVNIHEYGGTYLDDKALPGINEETFLKEFGEIKLPENLDIKEGWNKMEKKESIKDYLKRIENIVKEFKDMAKVYPDDYCLCIITHDNLLDGILSYINRVNFFVKKCYIYRCKNLALSEFIIEKKNVEKIIFNYINLSIDL